MYRRRRRPEQEIHFSFDSFLDLVANVVGIIIRLILVAWVGARTYTGVFHPPDGSKPTTTKSKAVAPSPEVLSEEQALEQARRRLAAAESALLEHLHKQDELHTRQSEAVRQLAALDNEAHKFEKEAADLDGRRQQLEKGHHRPNCRSRRCAGIDKLAKHVGLRRLPPAKKLLRYQTPVAQAVQSEELSFECRRGRVTFLDVEGLLREVHPGLRSRVERLRTQWQVDGETGACGAFRLRYVVSRQRGMLDAVGGPTRPASSATGWTVGWRCRSGRGAARRWPRLRPGSEFRRIVDRLDAEQTAVTFWVYPDSFATYRELRDYLLRRDVLVAGRPLPDDMPIASSRPAAPFRRAGEEGLRLVLFSGNRDNPQSPRRGAGRWPAWSMAGQRPAPRWAGQRPAWSMAGQRPAPRWADQRPAWSMAGQRPAPRRGKEKKRVMRGYLRGAMSASFSVSWWSCRSSTTGPSTPTQSTACSGARPRLPQRPDDRRRFQGTPYGSGHSHCRQPPGRISRPRPGADVLQSPYHQGE